MRLNKQERHFEIEYMSTLRPLKIESCRHLNFIEQKRYNFLMAPLTGEIYAAVIYFRDTKNE